MGRDTQEKVALGSKVTSSNPQSWKAAEPGPELFPLGPHALHQLVDVELTRAFHL